MQIFFLFNRNILHKFSWHYDIIATEVCVLDIYITIFINNKTKGENIMCDKLNQLSKLSIGDLYDQYQDIFFQVPVDIEGLLKKLDVKFDEVDFSQMNAIIQTGEDGETVKLPEQAQEILGAVACVSIADANNPHHLIEDYVKISVNKYDDYVRKRFTLAHELAHCMIDSHRLKNGYVELRREETDDTREKKINELAANILLPEKSLKQVHDSLFLPVLQILANRFKVSENVMRERLQNLGLEFITL